MPVSDCVMAMVDSTLIQQSLSVFLEHTRIFRRQSGQASDYLSLECVSKDCPTADAGS